MEKIKLTTKVEEIVNPPKTFKLTVEFDDGEDIELFFGEDKEEEVLFLRNIYEDYTIKLDKDWNSWCNPEFENTTRLLLPYLEKYCNDIEETKDMDEDELRDYFWDYANDLWSDSNEYDCMARCNGSELTYFDENGVEWNTKIKG
jgi:hypothetical protein